MKHRGRCHRAPGVQWLAAAACLVAGSALAAPALEVVEVTARRLATAGESASVAVSRRAPAAASETAPVLPSDLFRGMPGTFVQQTTPGQGIPIVRGLKGSQVL
ncbi:MAG TPA: hypothetical protein VJ947_06095, partial [Pseudohaliea sp.]|nr:hypothetical protein [Pseudohaliea sp.]